MWRRGLVLAIALGLLACLLPSVPVSPADTEGPKAPATSSLSLTPVSALHAGLTSNLKQVRSWLDDGDFISAEQTAQGLTTQAWLYHQQGSDDAWRRQTADLHDACGGLTAAAHRKDAAACQRALRTCTDRLARLEKIRPTAPVAPGKVLRPPGSTKTWMLLLEGAYVDGKTATSAEELAAPALVIAETVNVVSSLRADPGWRRMAGDVRTAALFAAETARRNDPDAARKAFKNIYTRCEACHNDNKR